MPNTQWRTGFYRGMLPVWSNTILLLLLLGLTATALSGTGSSDTTKPTSKNSTFIRKVPTHIRVEGSYFVHMKRGTSRERIEELVSEIESLDRDPSLDNFTAQVREILTNAALGFPAWLSEEAVQKVRVL